MRHQALFLLQFLKDPTSIGSVIPSGRSLAREMVKGIGETDRQLIAELGPGTGALTKEIARRMGPNCRYFGFETSAQFRQLLEERFPSLQVVGDGAQNMKAHLGSAGGFLDFVISSIPFTTLPWPLTVEILEAVHASLRPGGVFRTFLYLNTFFMPKNQRLLQEAGKLFSPLSQDIVLPNFPPAVVYSFQKRPLELGTGT